MKQNSKRININVPTDVQEWLEDRARYNGALVGSEIVPQPARRRPNPTPTPADPPLILDPRAGDIRIGRSN